jgi:hypothetical protein
MSQQELSASIFQNSDVGNFSEMAERPAAWDPANRGQKLRLVWKNRIKSAKL